ncbi:DUF262 domain-containing HNH endonuclease family protein [Kocuria sp. LUK]|uniref:DUF262 domain-containing protein n=1 Tax=Kocuria sp. LUK TaxID=2897828 RepID=UPI001E610021|nr:DUF262 domain-containing protein [Kocuria sp. LUK]MCD1144566.1 DUF262 domain-containing HNH endonuclease family protein [Kocuria sp. LUK]
MEAHPRSPRDLFEGKEHYEIPAFQRPYVWTEEDQWAPLWDDVVRVAEGYVLAKEADTEPETPQHFLGAVVYVSKPAVAGDVTRHEVIDGQQRMTTLQLLLDAAHQVLDEREHELHAEGIEDLIANKSKAFVGKRERFKLWPSQADRKAFAYAMDPEGDWEGEHRIVESHTFFRAEATRWITGEPDEDGSAPPGTEELRVEALSSTLQDRLTLVAIDLSGHDDSQLIFETLNDRGTPLLKADLIKNWVFHHGEALRADVEKWSVTHWSDFDDVWWREEIAQGRQVRSRVDIFLQYWLTMRLQEEVKTDHVFRVFAEYAKPKMRSAMAADALLTELRRDADTYRSFAQLDARTSEGRFYSRVIETMELAATTPLFLWLLSENHRVPQDQLRLALESVESWVIRRTLLRMSPMGLNRFMVTIIKALDGVPAPRVGHKIHAFLSEQTAESRLWPTDADVIGQLPEVKTYGNIKQSRLRVVLAAIEQHLRHQSPKHEEVSLPAGLQIEHVMPRGWRTHWNTPELSPEKAAKRDKYVNTIGNLTLVTKSLNSSLSNRPWTDAAAIGLKEGGEVGKGKWALLDEFSLLVLNKEILKHIDSWTEDDIKARNTHMAKAICAVWPGPIPMSPTAVATTDASPGKSVDPEVVKEEPSGTTSAAESADDLLRRFNKAMQDVYVRAKKEAGYNATYYLEMLNQYGGLETARRLLASNSPSKGFTALWERKRLDLTVENTVLDPEFQVLFNEDELELARRRLADYNFPTNR